jgi:hypothetical protein
MKNSGQQQTKGKDNVEIPKRIKRISF